MVKEFEGKTEREAIAKAVEELGIDREKFDVEVIDKPSGFFRKGNVRIKVYLDESNQEELIKPAKDNLESSMIEYIEKIIEKMGYQGQVSIYQREEKKIRFEIISEHTAILIGRKGKNIDALQLLANIYAGRLGSDIKIVIDAENYRERREDNLVRLAKKSAKQVRDNGRSVLLEPMNPFERRLVHTALNDISDVDTISEGDGLYKQIRVIYRGDVRD